MYKRVDYGINIGTSKIKMLGFTDDLNIVGNSKEV